MVVYETHSVGPSLVAVTIMPKLKSASFSGRSPFSVNVLSLCKRTIGFKIRTNKPAFYLVNPNRGLLFAKKTLTCHINMSETADRRSVQGDVDEHSFVLTAVVWPNQLATFDSSLFDKLETSANVDRQLVTVAESHTPVQSTRRPSQPVAMQQVSPFQAYMQPVDLHAPGGEDMRAMRGVDQLMTVYPTHISFQPPYGHGTLSQLRQVNVTCSSQQAEAIAFKVETKPSIAKFYCVNPNQGILLAGATVTVDFELKNNYAEAALLGASDEHCFYITAIHWPQRLTHFDEQLWHDIGKRINAEKQSSKVRCELDRAHVHQDEHVREDEHVHQEGFNTDGVALVDVNPKTVSYQPPFGKKKQFCYVTMTNLQTTPVAFKMQTNKREFYYVRPNKGVVAGGQSVEMELELNNKFTLDDAREHPNQHTFQLNVTKWPKGQFDADLWTKLNRDTKHDHQVITFDVNIPGAEQEERQGKHRTERQAQPPVRVHPTTITFKPPYGTNRQQQYVYVRNVSNQPIAFKFQTNRTKFYIVRPGKGVLQAGQEEKIMVELKETLHDDDVQNTDEHKFEVVTMPWPLNSDQFDIQLWNKCKNKDNVHTVKLDLVFKH